MNRITQSLRTFSKDEDGAQVIEYALIIAVVSLALIVALATLTGTPFSGWINKVTTCFTTPASCAQ